MQPYVYLLLLSIAYIDWMMVPVSQCNTLIPYLLSYDAPELVLQPYFPIFSLFTDPWYVRRRL